MEGFYSTQTPGKLESGFKEGKKKNEREQMEPQVRWELSRGCCRSIVFARYRRCDSDSEFAMLAYSIMLWLWSDAQLCCAGSPSPKDRNSQLSLINIAVVISVSPCRWNPPASHRLSSHRLDIELRSGTASTQNDRHCKLDFIKTSHHPSCLAWSAICL